jgi:hypothetical protein
VSQLDSSGLSQESVSTFFYSLQSKSNPGMIRGNLATPTAGAPVFVETDTFSGLLVNSQTFRVQFEPFIGKVKVPILIIDGRDGLSIELLPDWVFTLFKHYHYGYLVYLNRIYKRKMSSVKKWQMFGSSHLALTSMNYKSSNVEGAVTEEESLKKRGVNEEERQRILPEELPTLLYAMKPGLLEIKQVELWSKYRPLVPKEYQDKCCPRPCKEVIDREKDKKKEKGKLKRDEKKEKGKLKVPPTLEVATASSSSNDPQELTIKKTLLLSMMQLHHHHLIPQSDLA